MPTGGTAVGLPAYLRPEPAGGASTRRSGTFVAAYVTIATAALVALLALSRRVPGDQHRSLGGAAAAAAAQRQALAAQQRRLAAALTGGAGASGVGCPGPPVAIVEPAPVQDKPLVVVTGGAGFIGVTLVESLLSLGYAVRVLDNLSTGNASRLPAAHPRLELVVGDVTSREACTSALAGARAVVHLAAFSRVAPSLQGGVAAAEACQRANVQGTLNVLAAAHAAGVRRFLYAGSSTAYGGDEDADVDDDSLALLEQAYGAPMRTPALPSWEGDRAAPRTPYAVSKHQGELLCAMFDATYGLHTTSLRLFMVFGPHEPRDGPHATVVGRFVEAAARGNPLRLDGGGTQTRDFVHVTDVARAFVLALQAPRLPRRAVINIGSGVATRILDVANALAEGPHAHSPRRRQDLPHTLATTCAAARLLGWAPRVALMEGLEEMMARERG